MLKIGYLCAITLGLLSVLVFTGSQAEAAWQCQPDYASVDPFANCVIAQPEGVDGDIVVNTQSIDVMTVNQKRELLLAFARFLSHTSQ